MNKKQIAYLLAYDARLSLSEASNWIDHYFQAVRNSLVDQRQVTIPCFGAIIPRGGQDPLSTEPTKTRLRYSQVFLRHFNKINGHLDQGRLPTSKSMKPSEYQSYMAIIRAANVRYSETGERFVVPAELLKNHEVLLTGQDRIQEMFLAVQKLIMGLILCRVPITLNNYLSVKYKVTAARSIKLFGKGKKHTIPERLRPVFKAYKGLHI